MTTETAVQAEPAERDEVRPRPLAVQRSRNVLQRLGRSVVDRYALLAAMVVLIGIFSALRPDVFLTAANFTSMLGIQAPLAVLALGVTVVLLVGEFDLSAASVMGMSAAVMAYLTTVHEWPVLVALAVVLVSALAIGLTSAFFVVKVGIHSFIVTLGMGTLVTGAALGVAGSTTIGGVPDSLTSVFRTRVLGVDAAFFIMLAIAVIGWIVLQKTPVGRNTYFVGQAPTAAALAGIKVPSLRVGALVTSSLLAALAGVMMLGQVGAASPGIASPYLLPAYAAGFLGATAFTPGRFNVWGTVFAVYLLAIGTVGFQLLGFSNWVTSVFNGSVLILAVTFSTIFAKRR
ncbi:ABC transporter permease [Ornithinimicrobium sufpigmenti]|uniref:ABC transporter permease n=1 Tax=Ornithinimicrobium sufpigmenti TaxID=2508882 RepID=UPI001036C78D|nr:MULTISPECIES: ABC transporter permease [unclassified Ornithinimicrobium]